MLSLAGITDKTGSNVLIASDQELSHMTEMLKNIDFDISVSMSYVRRAQGLTFEELSKRFTGISKSMLKRYMQQSYPSMRPIHLVAAYSWVTMVPMTSFYYGFKITEAYRGMDHAAVEAIICVGKLPSNQFDTALELIYNFLIDDVREQEYALRKALEAEHGVIENYNELFPPPVLDLNLFAEDYYRSVAITAKQFRACHNFSMETMAKVLDISVYQYSALENIEKVVPLSMAIGFRVKLGFKIESHADFTSEMIHYPNFHRLRRIQQVRDTLIISALSHLSPEIKQHIVNMLKHLSKAYL